MFCIDKVFNFAVRNFRFLYLRNIITVSIMSENKEFTLDKKERMNSKILIEKLFSGESKSIPAFPLRIVYMIIEDDNAPTVSILTSVPKKRFKRAVKRNRVKRQMREAYRKNKSILTDVLEEKGKKAAIAFIWLDKELHTSEEVEKKVVKLLQLTSEKII